MFSKKRHNIESLPNNFIYFRNRCWRSVIETKRRFKTKPRATINESHPCVTFSSAYKILSHSL